MNIIHPTWERDFMKGLLRRRVSLKKELSTSPSSSSSNNKQPYIVGLVGMPGSGKVRYDMIVFAGKGRC